MASLKFGKRVHTVFDYFSKSSSKTFIAFCCLFLGGIALGSVLPGRLLIVSDIFWYAGLFIILAGVVIFWKYIFLRFILLVSLFFVFGLWRVSVANFDCNSPANICAYAGKRVSFVAKISSFGTQKIGSREYVVQSKQINEIPKVLITGKVLLRLPLYSEFKINQLVLVNCFLQLPQKSTDGFRYDRYLASHGIEAVCIGAPVISELSPPLGFNLLDYLKQQIYSVRNLFYNTSSRIWREPENSFNQGLLFGGSSSLPADLQTAFQRTGLSHVLAVSGFNVTIIASALMSILILIGLWRNQAFWITLFALICFVIMTGATASVVRAAIMGALVLLAQYLGRFSSMGPALSFTAAVMVLISPYILLYDAGFQLSFLATIGIVYLAPVIKDVIARSKATKQSLGQNAGIASSLASLVPRNDVMMQLSGVLIQTMSAIIMTLPLMLYQFGLISLVAPVVNVLLLWSVPWLMLGGFLAIIMGIFYLPLGNILGVPVMLASRLFLFIVVWFANLKYAALNIKIEWWVMLAMYAFLIYLIARKYKNASNVSDVIARRSEATTKQSLG